MHISKSALLNQGTQSALKKHVSGVGADVCSRIMQLKSRDKTEEIDYRICIPPAYHLQGRKRCDVSISLTISIVSSPDLITVWFHCSDDVAVSRELGGTKG